MREWENEKSGLITEIRKHSKQQCGQESNYIPGCGPATNLNGVFPAETNGGPGIGGGGAYTSGAKSGLTVGGNVAGDDALDEEPLSASENPS